MEIKEDHIRAIEAFIINANESHMVIPSQGRQQRFTIHQFCEQHNLYTKSTPCRGTEKDKKDLQIQKSPFSTEHKTYAADMLDERTIAFFVKMTRISIPTTDPRHFDYYVQGLDKYTGSIQTAQLFRTELREKFCNRLDRMEAHGRTVTESIVRDIRALPGFSDAMQLDITKSKLSQKDSLYTPENSGKCFLSIDICKANYTMLQRQLGTEALCDTWSDLVRRYTDSEFFIQSKFFRENIFGNLRVTKKTDYLAACLIQEAVLYLNETMGNLNNKIVLQRGDEVVFQIEDKNVAHRIIEQVHSRYSSDLLKISLFKLTQLAPKRAHFVKEDIDGHAAVQFKHVPKRFIMQAVKHYEGKPVLETDRLFMDDGEFAMFVNNHYQAE